MVGSSIARETEAGVYNHAGPEIGVASTKIFISQLTILTLLALLLGRHHNLSLTDGVEAIRSLEALPDQVTKILSKANQIQAITGATISSRAVVKILNKTIHQVRSRIKKNGG